MERNISLRNTGTLLLVLALTERIQTLGKINEKFMFLCENFEAKIKLVYNHHWKTISAHKKFFKTFY